MDELEKQLAMILEAMGTKDPAKHAAEVLAGDVGARVRQAVTEYKWLMSHLEAIASSNQGPPSELALQIVDNIEKGIAEIKARKIH